MRLCQGEWCDNEELINFKRFYQLIRKVCTKHLCKEKVSVLMKMMGSYILSMQNERCFFCLFHEICSMGD